MAKARRRWLAQLALEESTLALSIALGGAIVLLLAGTRILDWYWIALVAAASLGVGLYRLRKRVPSTYRIAQRIDRKLKLADALSTALYFAGENASGDEAVRNLQRREAETIARSVDLRAGIPFRRPRFAYPAAALAVVACGLFALRFGITRSLDLRPSLVAMTLDTFFPPHPNLASNTRRQDVRKTVPSDPGKPDSPTAGQDKAAKDLSDSSKVPDEARSETANQSKSADPADPPDDASKNDSASEAKDEYQGINPNQADQGKGDPPKDDKQSAASLNAKQASNENSSLMNKLKDAMSDMLNKIKPPRKNGLQAQQNGKKNQNGNPNPQQKGARKSQQEASNSETQTERNNNGGSSQSADAKGGDKSIQKNMPADAKTGAGSADGDKSAREAEELQAMGKISEILGKRAENVTGEVMVEVGSTKQQLKTPFAQREATHAEAGGEIHRDEVPLMYQQFVERYFEEIRKSPKGQTR
ncbi:MAG: hypothetical protein ACRD30_06695 [Bryobacteraceae bacterium]